MATTGAMVVMTDSAMPSNTSASGWPSSRATGVPASPPAATDGWSGIWPIRGTPTSAANRAPPPEPNRA